MADFVIGDYKYTTLSSPNTVSVQANDTTKSSYEDVPANVTYGGVEYSVTDMSYCFDDCTSLMTAPIIPSSVTDMSYCFRGCTSLTGDIYVYPSALSLFSVCFSGTTQPITLHAMNNNMDICQALAQTANNNNVYVNVHPETPILFTDTQMNYMTDDGLKFLSLQTNANLVQCEIPNLVSGSGTITTNVNDALIDLWTRQPLYSPSFTGSKTVNGITIVNNGDGSFTVSGTATAHAQVNLIETRVLCNDGSKYDFSGGMLKTISFPDGWGNWVATDLGTRVITTRYIATRKQWLNTSIVIGNGGGGEVSKSNISMTGTDVPIWKIRVIFNCVEGQTIPLTTFTPKITKAGDV